MRHIGWISATALSTLMLAAPNAKAGDGLVVGAGAAGFAAGTAIGAAAEYDYDDDVDVVPARRPYSWGGPELVGYRYVPATSVVESEETTVIAPRPVRRTIVDEGYDPRVRAGYATRSVSRGYDADIGTRSYGYRTAGYREGYGMNARTGYGYAGRTHVTNRSYGVEGSYRTRDHIRGASVRGEASIRSEGRLRGGRDDARSASTTRGAGLSGGQRESPRGGTGVRNVSASSGESMNRGGSSLRGSADVQAGGGMRGGAGAEGSAGGRGQLR